MAKSITPTAAMPIGRVRLDVRKGETRRHGHGKQAPGKIFRAIMAPEWI